MDTSSYRKQRRWEINRLLGRRLAELRHERHINQVVIADYMGFKRPLVSKIEKGERLLSAAEIFDYAQALGLEDPAELFDSILQISVEYDGRQRSASSSDLETE